MAHPWDTHTGGMVFKYTPLLFKARRRAKLLGTARQDLLPKSNLRIGFDIEWVAWREWCWAILGRNRWNDPRKLLSPSPWVGFEYTCQLFIGRNLPVLSKYPPYKVCTLLSNSYVMRRHAQCASKNPGSHSDQTKSVSCNHCSMWESLLFLDLNINPII